MKAQMKKRQAMKLNASQPVDTFTNASHTRTIVRRDHRREIGQVTHKKSKNNIHASAATTLTTEASFLDLLGGKTKTSSYPLLSMSQRGGVAGCQLEMVRRDTTKHEEVQQMAQIRRETRLRLRDEERPLAAIAAATWLSKM